ncbi:hypothetical protein COBT_003431 [Conglomerata obtusa]
MVLFILSNKMLAKFVNKFIPEDVITKITRIENIVASHLEISKRNQYNEIFMLEYQVKNENGHKEAYNIIEKYLNAYSSLHDKNEFCITTIGKEDNYVYFCKENKLLKFMQNSARLYKQKADLESVEYNNMHMYTANNRDFSSIRDKFAISQCIFIDYCMVNEEDFALYYYNYNDMRGGALKRDYNHVFINLKFDSSMEKQNWLTKHPFISFFGNHDFLIRFKIMFIFRHETIIPLDEFVHDETKNYSIDQLIYFDENIDRKKFNFLKYSNIQQHCITHESNTIRLRIDDFNGVISNSYFLVFREDDVMINTGFKKYIIEKRIKGECVIKKQFNCFFYTKYLQFIILRCKKTIRLKEFPMNDNLFEIFLDIIIVKNDNIIIGEITFKYIAHASDIDSFYMPAYMLPKYEEEIIGYETKFNAFLQEIKKYFAQSFSDYDENKRLCFD